MKKILVGLFLLVSIFSFSQEKKKTLDSLSKIYKKKVYSFGCVSYRGVKKTHIRYIENGKEITEVIKTEYVGTPVKKEE